MVTLKSLKPILKKIERDSGKLLVCDNKLQCKNPEIVLVIKDDFGLSKGLYHADTIDLVDPYDTANIESFTLDTTRGQEFTFSLNPLKSLLPYCSDDPTRPRLCGIAINKGYFVATNVHILKAIKIKEDIRDNYIIPSSGLKILTMLLKKYKIKDDFTCIATSTFFIVDNDFFKIEIRLIQREYVKWETFYSVSYIKQLNITKWIDLKDLKHLIKESSSVMLKTVQGDVILSFKNYPNNHYIIGSCDKSLKDTIGFNINYLDIAASGSTSFLIKYNNELSPTRVNESIVMPLRL